MTNIPPVTQTVGQKLDAVLAEIKTGAVSVETAAVSDFAKAKAWVATNWPHFVSWLSIGWVAFKVGALKLL
jgi:hypothetical protein